MSWFFLYQDKHLEFVLEKEHDYKFLQEFFILVSVQVNCWVLHEPYISQNTKKCEPNGYPSL